MGYAMDDDPKDDGSDDLFKNTEARTSALQCLWLWGITTLLLFFVGIAMMMHFPTMPLGAKVFCFIFWFLCYVFSTRKMRTALFEFSPPRVSPPNQDEGSSK
jgi:hypothetical protein